MKRENLLKKTLGEMVTDDFRSAALFKKAGLDFCCGGKKSLESACAEKKADPDNLINQLLELEKAGNDKGNNFKEWPASFLSDYIVNTHHKYVLKTLPDLLFYTAKIAEVHGERHKELYEVTDLFSKINSELLQHLKNEETVLFPAIKQVQENSSPATKTLIRSEIERMTGEHEFAGGAMDRINELTNGCSVPSDSCNTYAVTMKLLEEFEDDLHTHVHLENNILYPAALKFADGTNNNN
jgi:regulator of cell morphogenesis and NO signaling